MKAVQNIVRTFSTPVIKTVGEIIQHRQVNLGIIPPVAQSDNAALLKIMRDRQETLAKETAPYSVNDCLAVTRVTKGYAEIADLTKKQQKAYEQYVGPLPTSTVQAAENKGTVIAPSQTRAI